jgi:hypothetical protein
VRDRNCPAAVSRNEHPSTTGFPKSREDGLVETPFDRSDVFSMEWARL